MRDSVLRLLPLLLLLCCAAGFAQQTVFNVPNGDVLDRGKVYGEMDFSYNPDSAARSFTPRVVAGLGRRVEVGLNLNGLTAPGPVQATPTPVIKWKAYDGGKNGWALMVGDDFFIPAQNRSYQAGTYLYAEVTRTLAAKTRFTFGAYDFTRHVVAPGNRAGGQFAIEQPLTNKVAVAADWFTGNHSLGYLTPGASIKLAPRLTAYLAWQIGNSGALNGNSQLLLELGWNFN